MLNIDLARARRLVEEAIDDFDEIFGEQLTDDTTLNFHPWQDSASDDVTDRDILGQSLTDIRNGLIRIQEGMKEWEVKYPAPDGKNLREDILFFFRRYPTYSTQGYYRSDWSVEQQLRGSWDRKDILVELEKLEQEGILERHLEGNCDRQEDEYGQYDDSCENDWNVSEDDYDDDTLICPKCESDETHTNWAYRLKMG